VKQPQSTLCTSEPGDLPKRSAVDFSATTESVHWNPGRSALFHTQSFARRVHRSLEEWLRCIDWLSRVVSCFSCAFSC